MVSFVRRQDGEVLTAAQVNTYLDGIEAVSDQSDAHVADMANPHATTKAQIGLGNVDNTSDVDKPISIATQNALDEKASAASSHEHSNLTILTATTASFTTAQQTKLSGIETGADKTDATNVNAAGAVMNDDATTASMAFVVDEDAMTSNSATKVPTQQSVKAYVDNSVSNVEFTPPSAGMRIVQVGGASVEADAELVNVREYNILGNTNERVKIQNLVDAIRDGTQRRRILFFPELPAGQTYQTDDTIVLSDSGATISGQIRWQGANKNRSILELTGSANVPIVMVEDPYGSYGFEMFDLQLRYENRPISTQTQRYGFQIRSSADGSYPSGGGVYLSHFERLIFDNCYVGIGEWGTGSGKMPFWSSTFRDITFFHTKQHAFKFMSGGGTIGHPNIILDGINILNYDQGGMGTGDGVRNGGPAIIAQAMTGFHIYNLNIEDWWNRHLQITGGSYCLISGLRLERARLDEPYPVMFTLNNNVDVVRGVDLGGIQQKTGLDFGRIFDTYASQAIIEGVVGSGRDASASDVDKVMYGLWSDPGGQGSVVANAFRPQGQLTTHNPGHNNSMGIRQINGAPPLITLASLPAASAYYHGATVLHRTSNTTALKTCLQTDATTYAWTTIT